MVGVRKFFISETELRKLYPVKTMAEIAIHFGCGETTVFKRIKEFGIQTTKLHRNQWSEESRLKKSQAQAGRVGPRTGETKKCLVCNSPFYVIPARVKTAKYCSNACRGKMVGDAFRGNKHPRYLPNAIRSKSCEGCGNEIIHTNQPITSFQKQKFCSKPCADKYAFRYSGSSHANYKGDAARAKNRPAKVSRWAEKILRRDKHKCQRCNAHGPDVSLQAHHIRPYQFYPSGRTDLNNGVTLCASCHWEVHASLEPRFLDLRDAAAVKPAVTKSLLVQGKVIKEKRFGRESRKWVGNCYWCNCPIERRLSDVTGKKSVFCGKNCSHRHNRAFNPVKPSKNPLPSSVRPPEFMPLLP